MMKHLLPFFLLTSVSVQATLSFEWSGDALVSGASGEFSITIVVPDVQSGETGFNTNSFTSTALEISTETTAHKQLTLDVSGTIIGIAFGGTYSFPSDNVSDPYDYLFAEQDGTGTILEMLAGADSSNIGLNFAGAPVTRVWFQGVVDLPFTDPSTASSLADIFPVGTYSVTENQGQFSEAVFANFPFASLSPTSLTISSVNPIPEPATILGAITLLATGVAFWRKSRRAR